MSHSSISSSDAAVAHVRTRQFSLRRVWRFPVCVLALLAGAELMLRIPAVRHALPIRTHYHEPGIVRRVEALEQVLADHGTIDILFVGSSIVRCNIQPLDFDLAVLRRGLREVSFNGGLSGLWPNAVALYVEHLWLPKAHPAVLVQGIRFGELHSSPRARRESAILSGPIEGRWRTNSSASGLEISALERIHLLQYRGTLPRWLESYERGAPGESLDDDGHMLTDSRGWTPRLPTLDVALSRGLLHAEAPYSAPIKDAETAAALAAIGRTAELCRRAGVRYVLVNVPEHAFRWSGPDGAARYADYIATLRALAQSLSFEFIDVTNGDSRRFANDAEYSDYHHMSPAGAHRFTMMLASELGSRLPGTLTADRR